LELEQSGSNTAHVHLQLAIVAHNWGLDAELWQHLDRAVTLPFEAEHSCLPKRLGDFLAQLEPEVLPHNYRSAATRLRVHELLVRQRPDAGPGRKRVIEELLVREANADKDLRAEARGSSDAYRRLGALAAARPA